MIFYRFHVGCFLLTHLLKEVLSIQTIFFKDKMLDCLLQSLYLFES